MSLYSPDDALQRVLRRYKDAPLAEERTHYREALAGVVAAFLSRHEACLEAAAGAPFDVVTVVPSTGRTGRVDPAPHPLEAALATVPTVAGRLRTLLARGSAPVGHRAAADGAFVPIAASTVDGTRVLLVDDTLTTGARLHSAASALSSAGARSVVAAVVGRVVHPDRDPRHARFWTAVSSRCFDATSCVLCAHRAVEPCDARGAIA